MPVWAFVVGCLIYFMFKGSGKSKKPVTAEEGKDAWMSVTIQSISAGGFRMNEMERSGVTNRRAKGLDYNLNNTIPNKLAETRKRVAGWPPRWRSSTQPSPQEEALALIDTATQAVNRAQEIWKQVYRSAWRQSTEVRTERTTLFSMGYPGKTVAILDGDKLLAAFPAIRAALTEAKTALEAARAIKL